MNASRVMKARKTSTCPLCRKLISRGQQIGRTPIGWCHTQCIIEEATRCPGSTHATQAPTR